jgi:hypothetical protein
MFVLIMFKRLHGVPDEGADESADEVVSWVLKHTTEDIAEGAYISF